MNFLFKPENTITNIEKTLSCYLIFCADIYKIFIIKRDVYINKRDIIINKYISNEIKKKEFIDKMNNLHKLHFNSNYYKKFASCVINNCYEKCKKNLDVILLKIPDIKYKKPLEYTVNDFIYLYKQFHYYNITMKIVKSKSIKNLIKIENIIDNY